MTPRRRLVPRLAAGLAVSAVLALTPAAPARAQDQEPERAILVVEVDGLLDPVTADLVTRTVDEAERTRAALLVLALDSAASVDVDVDALVDHVDGAAVPVAAWVKGGGEGRGAAARLLAAADLAAIATDARLVVAGRSLDPSEARQAGLVDVVAPSLRDLVASLDGRDVEVAGRRVTLELGDVVGGEDRKQVLPIRFRELGLADQAQHALTSPFVAYLLLVLGLCLVVFEFFAIGIGLAALAGALLVLGAFVGFAHLPVDWVFFGLLLGGFAAVSIDVQAGAPRFWATVGGALVLVGSLGLYDGPAAVDPPVWQVLLVVAGALTFLLPGLAAVVRARFSTPTIGREWMVGERGKAREAVDPEGVVTVRGAPWRARTTRAAEIGPGDAVEVVAVQGLVLEVQPLTETSESRAQG